MREFELLQHVYAANPALGAEVVIPPGDDMGGLRLGDRLLLVTVDQVADGVHVQVEGTPLDLIARKAIVRNLSDVAAMAAKPLGAVAAVSLPRDFGEDRARKLADALRYHADRYGCPMFGGDVSIWDHPLLITVTVLAEPGPTGPILRSGARPDDRIYVTGQLGGAWDEQGGGPHLHAEPRIELAHQLAAQLGPDLHSMIDLSDGLAGDLGHICRMSQVAAEVDTSAIPLRPEAAVAAERDGQPAWQHALSDGEDYELCFTVAAGADVPAEIDGIAITCIGAARAVGGQATEASTITLRHADGQTEPLHAASWEHHG